MFDRVGEWAAALDLTGAVSLPAWAVAVVAAAVVVVAALAFVRAGVDAVVPVVGSALVLIVGPDRLGGARPAGPWRSCRRAAGA